MLIENVTVLSLMGGNSVSNQNKMSTSESYESVNYLKIGSISCIQNGIQNEILNIRKKIDFDPSKSREQLI